MNTKKERIIGIAFSLCAACAYGTTQVLVRSGITDLQTPPLVGSALALLSGTIVLSVFGLRDLGTKLEQEKKSVGLMLIEEIFAGSGVLTSFFALSIAPVTTVSPLTATNPLFALLWSFLFLSRLEKINLRVVMGTVLVVVGVILITINS